MYHFALVALMALAVVKVVDVLTDNVEALQRFRSLLTIAFGVGIVLWLDYSIFEGWNIAIDDRDTGLWLTGFMVAGMTVPWRAVFGYLTHDRAAVGRDPRAALPHDQARRLAHALSILRWAPEHAPGPIVASGSGAARLAQKSSSTAAAASGAWYGQKWPAPSSAAKPAPRASAHLPGLRLVAEGVVGRRGARGRRPASGPTGPSRGAGWAWPSGTGRGCSCPSSASRRRGHLHRAVVRHAERPRARRPDLPRTARSAPRRRPRRRRGSARAGRSACHS